jgi:hypothetical protein
VSGAASEDFLRCFSPESFRSSPHRLGIYVALHNYKARDWLNHWLDMKVHAISSSFWLVGSCSTLD